MMKAPQMMKKYPSTNLIPRSMLILEEIVENVSMRKLRTISKVDRRVSIFLESFWIKCEITKRVYRKYSFCHIFSFYENNILDNSTIS
jgi:hypothetical protein